jgi:O-antigen ligase
MEYLLSLEQKQKHTIFIIAMVVLTLLFLLSGLSFGIFGLFLAAAFLVFVLITPFLVAKYRVFLFLWLLLLPILSILNWESLSIFSINPITLLITGISLPYAIYLFYTRIGELIKKFPFLIFLIVFDAIIFLNIFRMNNPGYTAQIFRAFFILIFLIAITYYFIKNNSPKFIYNCLLSFSVLNATAAIFQKITGIGLLDIQGIPRVCGWMPHPNQCGFLINILWPLILYLIIQAKNKKEKVFLMIIFGLNILALIFTFSKASYLIFLFNLILFIILFGSVRTKMTTFAIILFSVICFLLIGILTRSDILYFISARFSENSSLMWRFKMWQFLLRDMDLSKLLFGGGLNSSITYLIPLISQWESPTPHNGYLLLLYELGIWGLSLIGFILAIFIKSFKYIMQHFNSPQKLSGIIPLLLSIAMLVEMFVDQATQARISLYYYAVLITIFYIEMNNNINNDLIINKSKTESK